MHIRHEYVLFAPCSDRRRHRSDGEYSAVGQYIRGENDDRACFGESEGQLLTTKPNQTKPKTKPNRHWDKESRAGKVSLMTKVGFIAFACTPALVHRAAFADGDTAIRAGCHLLKANFFLCAV